MFIKRSDDALSIMAAFIQSLALNSNRALGYKILNIVKDINHGLLECAFEEIETLPTEFKEKIPESYYTLFNARQAFCETPFSNVTASKVYQQAIDNFIEQNSPASA